MNETGEDSTEIQRIAAGNAEDFTRLYDLYRERVFGFAYRMLRSRSVAEEATQEAFMALIRHPERFRPELSSMLTFLCAVARNCILNHYRKDNAGTEDFLDDADLYLVEDESAPNPLSALMCREMETKVRQAVSLLPALQREVIVLREFQELSYEEISVVVGADTNVVKARLYRARQTLGKRLAPYLVSKGESCYELPKG